jgi:hypothetical protein
MRETVAATKALCALVLSLCTLPTANRLFLHHTRSSNKISAIASIEGVKGD